MRRALWIAEDLLRDGRSWGRWTGGLLLSVLLAAQAGWCEAILDPLPWPVSALDVRAAIAWTGAGPMLVAALIPFTFFTRRLERRLEPLLASPATAGEIVAGAILPGAAAALALAPIAWLSGIAGYHLKSGNPPADWAGSLPGWTGGLIASACLLSACALHGSLFARTPAGAVAALAPGLILVGAVDAGRIALAAAGLPSAHLLAFLVVPAVLAPAAIARRLDRGRLLACSR